MQKPTDGAQRPTDRLRHARTRASSASRLNGRSIRTARAIRSRLRAGSITALPWRALLTDALPPLATTPAPAAGAEPVRAGAILDDGTLLTGYAPATTVEDGSDLIRRYKVKSGDTLVMIARKFDVSMMTLWWANKLKAKDELHIGQVLRIPPVSGLVVTVGETDTLESLAAEHKVAPSKII